MKIRSPWLMNLFALLLFWFIRLWLGTLHYRMVQLDGDIHPTDEKRKRFVYACWHETLLFPTRFRVKIHVLISHHTDGELIARVCRHMGFKTVRGSSRRGGVEALRKLVRIGKTSHLLVTPDGPRGPRRRVQPGLILLAALSGLPIVPVGMGFERAWRFRSWDRFALPWPWTRAVGVCGPAICVPAGLGRDQLEDYRLLVEARLLEATNLAEHLAERRSGKVQGGDAGATRAAARAA